MSHHCISSRRFVHALAAVLLPVLAACATVQSPQRAHLQSVDASLQACARWFVQLDAVVRSAGVADAGAQRIAGFPYLRSDRFHGALGETARANTPDFTAWLEALRDLDSDARRVEIANLPASSIEGLGVAGREAAIVRSKECAGRLLVADLDGDAVRAQLVQRARVADDYSTLKRGFGLYAIALWPFSHGIRAWQRDAVQTIEAARAGEPPQAPLSRYQPPANPIYTRAQVAALLDRAALMPFGVPAFSAEERDRLFVTYAPLLEVETAADSDRIGALFWGDADSPQVDVSRPTLYRRLAYTRIDERTIVQLVYTAWFPARPKRHVFDLLGGHLDGIVWRVSLAPDGEPMLYDTIHPCGCFHMFFPTARVAALPSPGGRIEWAFVPAAVPSLQDGERMLVSVQTGSHYLRNVSVAGDLAGTRYAFADYEDLRSLPLPGGGTRSVFGPDALVPGTQRGERFLFWPMGIDSAGAMRQWGRHATAFVGRRHFDDADLIERRFRLLR